MTRGSPACSISVAMKWRRSCNRNGRRPAARRCRRNALVTRFGFHAVTPQSSLNTNASAMASQPRSAARSTSTSTVPRRGRRRDALVLVAVSTGPSGPSTQPALNDTRRARGARCATGARAAGRGEPQWTRRDTSSACKCGSRSATWSRRMLSSAGVGGRSSGVVWTMRWARWPGCPRSSPSASPEGRRRAARRGPGSTSRGQRPAVDPTGGERGVGGVDHRRRHVADARWPRWGWR